MKYVLPQKNCSFYIWTSLDFYIGRQHHDGEWREVWAGRRAHREQIIGGRERGSSREGR